MIIEFYRINSRSIIVVEDIQAKSTISTSKKQIKIHISRLLRNFVSVKMCIFIALMSNKISKMNYKTSLKLIF